MTFNVHLEQFDVAPTRAGILLICDYLINCKVCDVTLGGGLSNGPGQGRGKGKKIMKFV